MDDKTYFTLLGAATAIYGLYCLYIWFRLKRENYLFFNQILIPSGYAARDCKHPREYIKYMKTRLLVFGLIIFASGLLYVLSSQLFVMETWLHWVLFAVPVVAIIWFIITLIITRQRYWDDWVEEES